MKSLIKKNIKLTGLEAGDDFLAITCQSKDNSLSIVHIPIRVISQEIAKLNVSYSATVYSVNFTLHKNWTNLVSGRKYSVNIYSPKYNNMFKEVNETRIGKAINTNTINLDSPFYDNDNPVTQIIGNSSTLSPCFEIGPEGRSCTITIKEI